jgi:putative DNA primase/helicase
VEFRENFEDRRNANLDNEHACELPGILNLALDGLARLRERGRFEPSADMLKLREAYRQDCNPSLVWVSEALDRSDPDGWALCETAYEGYRRWCKDNGHTSFSRNRWTRVLGRMGIRNEKRRFGERTSLVLIGCTLRPGHGAVL